MERARKSLENLEKGRGKRPRLDNQTVAMRMSDETRSALEAIAAQYGVLYAGRPHIAGLLTKIAARELIIVPAPPSTES